MTATEGAGNHCDGTRTAPRPRPSTEIIDGVCLGRGRIHLHRPPGRHRRPHNLWAGQTKAADPEPDDRDGHSLLVQTFGSSFFRYEMNLMIYESSLSASGIPVLQGHDRWDLKVRVRSRPRHEPERGRGVPPCRPPLDSTPASIRASWHACGGPGSSTSTRGCCSSGEPRANCLSCRTIST
jgi:hypothetical protein